MKKQNSNTGTMPGSGMGRGPMMHGAPPRGGKPSSMKEALRRLIKSSRKQLPLLIIAFICAAASSLLSLVGPSQLARISALITEGMSTQIDIKAVGMVSIFLLIVFGISALLGCVQGVSLATATQSIGKRLRSDLSTKIHRLPIHYFNKTPYGDVLSRVSNDVDSVVQALSQSVGNLVSSLTLFVGSLILMLLTNWLMALTAVLSVILGFYLMKCIMSRSQKYFVAQQSNLGAMNGYIEELYTGHSVVQMYNAQKDALKEFKERNEALRDTAFRAQMFSGLMMPLMSFVGNFAYVAVCVVGAVLTLQGKIGFEVIVAFMLYVRFFTQPLSQLAQVGTSLQSAAAAAERVFDFLEVEELPRESEKPPRPQNIRGDVEFSHVRFGYEDTDKIVIHDFSAKAKAGQKVAIVGPTGAGKTTLVNLLMRFHELHSGEILIDGIPISSMCREDVHSLFCMVLQDSWLFEGTIRENLVYCKEDLSQEEIVAACKAAGIHHLIKTLPQGYDTLLSEESSLSVGERQQLTIARAMLQNAPMLILDEATSSVDTRTEQLVAAAMDRLMEGRTSFVIAHRLSTIRNADLILVIKEGDIIESGTHEELLALDGFYAQLYNSQFEGCED